MRRGDRWASMPSGFNDSISSIRLFGGVRIRLFNDSNFQGYTARLDHDVDDLHNIRVCEDPSHTWNDRISSIAVIGDQDQWDREHQHGDRQ
jgi:hypothetical protein